MKRKVLIVDDEPSIVKILGIYLNRAGYEVKSATSGSEALDIIKGYEPSIVTMDYDLGGRLNGQDTVKEMRAQGKTYPVVFITGDPANEDKINANAGELKPYSVLIKPVRKADLISAVDALLLN